MALWGGEGRLEAPRMRGDVNLELPDSKAHALIICTVASSHTPLSQPLHGALGLWEFMSTSFWPLYLVGGA